MNNDSKNRFVLALLLGLTFMLLMQYFLPQPQIQDQGQVRPSAQFADEQPIGAQSSSSAATPAPGASAEIADFNPTTDYTVKVRVGKEGKGEHGYEATFSTAGAGLSTYRLLGFYRVPGDASRANEVILLDRMNMGRDSLRIDSLTYGPNRQESRTLGLRNTRFELVEIPQNAVVEPEPGESVRKGDKLAFRAVVGDWEILKTYSFPAAGGKDADFTMKLDLEWRNIADGGRLLAYRLAGPAGLVADDDNATFGIINFLTARQPSPNSPAVEIERKAIRELVDVKGMFDQDNRANLAWVGAKNRFFTAIMTTNDATIIDSNGARRSLFDGDLAMIPSAPDIRKTLEHQPEIKTSSLQSVPLFEDILLAVEPGMISPGQSYKAQHIMYAGPAVDDLLEDADPRLHGVVSYTISYLDFISRWLVQLLVGLDKIIGNYGLAIIILTLLIKALLHPLNRKSFVSMNKMTKLAPQMKEIQKKYANDKVKMQQEMSKFYKDHGVSMAGSCLPMFLQLPIFFALYGAFSQGFSMRHAAFIPGWINDLSKPDSVYDLGWTIPILNSPHISLLPILYLALQYVQMSLQPTPSDPQQAQQQKMMKFMPLVFVFIFYSMPAGLVLYFTVSALAGVAENWWMRKVLLPKLGLGDSPAAQTAAAQSAAAGAGAAVVPSEASKKKKKKPRGPGNASDPRYH